MLNIIGSSSMINFITENLELTILNDPTLGQKGTID